ncbi:MAG: CHAP domain-containing protein [Deltaproteobacteria bacterium]|nr:MAG: CHAP domain-containing protein [Deltaproteobacteria bacterium]
MFKSILKLIVVAGLVVATASTALAVDWSVGRYISGNTVKSNPLPAGECTWLVDGLADRMGWDLIFSRKYGRDACLWYAENLVTNAKRGTIGYPGDIMVFNSGLFSSVGHVAYVVGKSTWNGKRAWTVRHANWKSSTGQKEVYKIDNRRILECTFVEVSPNKVSVLYRSGGRELLASTKYPLLGFLYKK